MYAAVIALCVQRAAAGFECGFSHAEFVAIENGWACLCNPGYENDKPSHCHAVECPFASHGTSIPDLKNNCRCDAGCRGNITAQRGSPWFNKTSGSACEGVSCPVNTTGKNVSSGCSCNAGFSGNITAEDGPRADKQTDEPDSKYYSGECSPVACPAHSSGASVPDGCACDAGYNGIITASIISPFYVGACSATACPTNSTGKYISSGCTCDAGFQGSISPSKTAPHYTGSCTPVACPAHSSGENVASGCTCDLGYKGNISAIVGGYSGSCGHAGCPAGSNGTSVLDGCTCSTGYSGTIVASSMAPYYSGECTPASCPNRTIGTNLISGCKCKAGYMGSVTLSSQAPFYTGACTADPCPVGTTGSNVVEGCFCNAGLDGTVYSNGSYTCAPASCPANSKGEDVLSGCTCIPEYEGSITAAVGSPFHNGSCVKAACPANSTKYGDVCRCNAGFTGLVKGIYGKVGYSSTCTPVSCPAHSAGASVPDGCTCVPGAAGYITPVQCSVEECVRGVCRAYVGHCQPVFCPPYSTGQDLIQGCKCNPRFTGTIVSATFSPYYTGECSTDDSWPIYGYPWGATSCLAGSTSSDETLAAGCTCLPGYNGVGYQQSKSSPFYVGYCNNVSCPANSWGNNVADGCTCDLGYAGNLTASTDAPYYQGSCQKATALAEHASAPAAAAVNLRQRRM